MWDWNNISDEMGISYSPESVFNIGYEVSNRVCQRGLGEKTAVICVGKNQNKKLTYNYISNHSSRFALFLKHLGIKKGDRVFTYCDKSPQFYISVIGILKAGAIFSPLFSSFGNEALKDRISDSMGIALIVEERFVNNILETLTQIRSLKYLIIIGNNSTINVNEIATYNFNEYEAYNNDFECENTSLNDPAIIHYTSGTTGKPKGAIHSHKALIGHYATTKYIIGTNKDDIYWCTADPAWITGSSYGIFGPLSNGLTQVAFEGNLNPRNICETIENQKVSILYTAPTLLRMLMREKCDLYKSYDLKSLKHIASVGEALNPQVIKWSIDTLGLEVYDTWFQTETGCIMIANTKDQKVLPGSMGKPISPISADILDEIGNPVAIGTIGRLAIQTPWPSIFTGYRNNEEVYKSKFINGWYITGDKAYKDENGYFWFSSREDDIINTAGHLVSPFEVESSLIEHPKIAEAAVIGIPDSLLAEKIKAFIVLKVGEIEDVQLKIELRAYVRKNVSPFAVPQEIEIVQSLPKTSSGKIMRRLLKSRELGLPKEDISSLES